MIVLYNTNKYLGGGETLLIRFSEYLQDVGVDYVVICAQDSYIQKSLKDNGRCVALDCDANFYYLPKDGQERLLGQLGRTLTRNAKVDFVTFCMRDLHTAFALSRGRQGFSITHLILHIQDDLYTGQTLLDKLRYKVQGERRFNLQSNIEFNRFLLKRLNENNALICMAEVIARYWESQFQIRIEHDKIVPLPSFVDKPHVELRRENNRSIIWLGRLVDFKIPAILTMVRFLATNDYTLTIVGSGAVEPIQAAIEQYKVDPARLKFIGELNYDAIGAEISKHAIGYGMGTSLVELAMYKIPVVVALASYDHEEFDQPICGGLFFDQPLGCDGSELILGSAARKIVDLQTAFDAIEADYAGSAARCHAYAKQNYSSNVNFQRYLEIITSAEEFVFPDHGLVYPTCSPIRRALFKALAPE